MYIAVCDDRAEDLNVILDILAQWQNERRVTLRVESFRSTSDLLNSARKEPFTLYFLDVIMPGISGMEAARQIQLRRFVSAGITCNAQMNNKHVEELANVSSAASAVLSKAMDKYALSMRGYMRMIKVARTIADLRGEEQISAAAMAEAIQYRTLDAKYWSR